MFPSGEGRVRHIDDVACISSSSVLAFSTVHTPAYSLAKVGSGYAAPDMR